VPGDACKFFDMTVPRLDILVAYRPVHGEAIPRRSFKIEVAPPLRLPRPQQRFAAGMIAPHPTEWLFLDEGLFIRFQCPMQRLLANERRTLVCGPLRQRYRTPVRKLPGPFRSRRVVLDMPDIPAPFEHQYFQPLFTQLLRRPASTGARADDNGIVVHDLML